MRYSLRVTVVESQHDLLKDYLCLFFSEVTFLNDFVEKLSTCAELGDHVDVPIILKRFVELYDIRVIELPEDLDLVQKLNFVSDPLFGDLLDSPPRIIGFLVLKAALQDGSECPRADALLLEFVVI